jgi:hypothetical protein
MEDVSEEEYESLNSPKNISSIRCKCGALVWLRMPCLCSKCKDPKMYWRMMDGKVVSLAKMDLGHLSNVVRMLAHKAEQYPSGDFRAEIEIAMDLIYAEIGSRELETEQLSGIMGALQRSLVGKEPCDA